MSQHSPTVSPFRQPKAVWAVAFACVISFMGIGLVDPILPALSTSLHASPSQVTLLFTSYLVVTAVAMLVTGFVSSRIGAKKTLVCGLVLIVAFSAAAGATGSIGGIVGFRAGWGLGNALFIATSLAVIVGSASGGFAGAIILYETALGIGIAIGPLLGGELGGISWRGPFFGVSVLMLIALIATVFLVEPTPKPERRTSLLDPLKALRHRGLLTMGLTALLYNWGFFTVLGYAPFPMNLGTHQLGYVFTGWGVLVAIFSVWGAPWLQARLGIAKALYLNLFLFALDILAIAIWTDNKKALIIAVIVAGAFIGINNTITTQAVMTVAPVERPVASAAYGFVRFIGGGLAPFAAGKMVERWDVHVPFYVGAGSVALGIVVLSTGHKLLAQAEKAQAADAAAHSGPQDEALTEAEALSDSTVELLPDREPVPSLATASAEAAQDGRLQATASTAALAPGGGTTGTGIDVHGFVRGVEGKPVNRAAVTLISMSGRQLGRSVAHPDGGYHIDTPGAGSYVLIASADGYQPQASTVVVGEERVAFDILLSGTSGLAGTVMEAESNSPVAEAVVIVTDTRGDVLATGTTDQHGRFTFAELVPGPVTVAVNAPSRRPMALPVDIGTTDVTRIEIPLSAGAGINGTVHAGGTPLDDARVTLVDAVGNVVATATTGTDGAYAFTDLEDGEYTVIATGYPPQASGVLVNGRSVDGHDVELSHPAD